MTQRSKICRSEYYDAMGKYWELINTLPDDMKYQFPLFDEFLSPAHVTHFLGGFDRNDIELSITGTQRYQMLQSPHARTLLAAWAAQRLKG